MTDEWTDTPPLDRDYRRCLEAGLTMKEAEAFVRAARGSRVPIEMLITICQAFTPYTAGRRRAADALHVLEKQRRRSGLSAAIRHGWRWKASGK